MKTSPDTKAISKAIVAAQPEIAAALKTSINPHFKSKYADLSAVWESCKDVLRSHKLAVIQTFSSENKEGSVLIETRLVHESGEWMQGELPMPIKDPNNPQAVGSAITYARRYSLSAILGIVTEEDDDGNNASQETYSKPILKEAKNFKKHEELIIRIEEETPLEVVDFLEGLKKQSDKITAKTILELTEKQIEYISTNFESLTNKILDQQIGETK